MNHLHEPCIHRCCHLAALAAVAISASGLTAADNRRNVNPAGHVKQNITLRGVVEGYPDPREFVLRHGNGWTYLIHPLSSPPLSLSPGDHVRAYGDWVDGRLQAINVRIVREANPRLRQQVVNRYRIITGVITKNNIGNEFVVLGRNGWTFPVIAVWGEPSTLSISDRVRAYGEWRRGRLYATNVRLLRDVSYIPND